MSVYHKADQGELIQWVTHESRSSAASNSGLIRIGTQPRTADAWHQWLMPAARASSPEIFRPFWPSVWPSSRSNFDLGPLPLDSTEKIFHVRAYDFGVQFSFNNESHGSHVRWKKAKQLSKMARKTSQIWKETVSRPALTWQKQSFLPSFFFLRTSSQTHMMKQSGVPFHFRVITQLLSSLQSQKRRFDSCQTSEASDFQGQQMS